MGEAIAEVSKQVDKFFKHHTSYHYWRSMVKGGDLA
jgi:hypothetical protein